MAEHYGPKLLLLKYFRAGQQPYARPHLKSFSEPICKREGLCLFSLVKVSNVICVMRDVNLTLSFIILPTSQKTLPLSAKSILHEGFCLTTLVLKVLSSPSVVEEKAIKFTNPSQIHGHKSPQQRETANWIMLPSCLECFRHFPNIYVQPQITQLSFPDPVLPTFAQFHSHT